MCCYNELGDNKGSISDILQLDTIIVGYALLTSYLVALKRKNHEPILTVKRTEGRQFIDYLYLNIEVGPSRVVKKNVYFVDI